MLIKTPAEILQQGLKLAGRSSERQGRCCNKTNEKLFRGHYGSSSLVCAQILADLQTTDNAAAHIIVKNNQLKYYFVAHHLLAKYETREDRASAFGTSVRSDQDWSWTFVKKIAALKATKITWPAEWADGNMDLLLPMTVDCSHFATFELQTDPNNPKDPRNFSHKLHGPAVSYEVALAIHESRIVSINGPFPAATNDLTIFRGKLEAMIPDGSKAIADKAYQSSEKIAISSSHDTPELRRFKSRARARQESLWRRLKCFKCLGDRYRHPIEKHQTFFDAVCVIMQYQFENGSPLFAV
jgi:hypothetical protein